MNDAMAGAPPFAAVTLSASEARALADSSERWDYVIVGAGTAGIPAAIFASRRGARVLLIDAADVVGGTLHMAQGQVSAGGTALQKAKGIVDTPDQHFEEVMQVTQGLADPNVVRLTVDHAPAMMDWLLENGLEPLADHPVTGESPGRPAYRTARYFWGAGAGVDILAVLERQLAPELASGRVTLQLGTRVTNLLLSPEGSVVGIGARSSAGDHVFHGRHILLTTGGYAMNPAMFEDLSGGPAYAAVSHPFGQGDGLALARDVAAGLRGRDMHRAGTGAIMDSDRFPAKFYAKFMTAPEIRLPWEIWVDVHGRRFMREDEPLVYERERAVASLPRLKYAIIFDQSIYDRAPIGIAGWTREKMDQHFANHPMFLRADTLDELARRVGIDPQGLRTTVASYNAAVESDHDALGRMHMPLPISSPPFYAIVHLGISNTSSVGLMVDQDLRVLRDDGTAIPNLYAAGEVLGSGATLGRAFAPGMMLTPALTLGRLLGERLTI